MPDTSVRYPDVEVQLTGEDGNTMSIVGRVRSALRAAGVPAADITAFSNEALDGDYDHVLRTVQRWVVVL